VAKKLALASWMLWVALAIGVGPTAAESNDRPLYELNFESGVVSEGKLNEASGRKSYPVSTTGAGQVPRIVFDATLKSKVLNFEVGPTPPDKGKDRSELAIYSGIDFGKTFWISMKVMVPSGNSVANNWHSLLQCPQAGMPSSPPPFSISMATPAKLMLISRSSEDKFKVFGRGDLPVGQWVQLELELKMGDAGRASLYLDGQLVSSGEAPLRFKEGQPRCTLKVGVYRGQASTPYAMRVDDIRLGTTRRSVSGH
jgi:hypothetical protein